ncbi:MAG: hypothetical protein MUC63_05880 [Planctomycetes bacterium]|jgi:hypothetical protein|nr:hypothetical protein [Planctomycetota bacterium]
MVGLLLAISQGAASSSNTLANVVAGIAFPVLLVALKTFGLVRRDRAAQGSRIRHVLRSRRRPRAGF